MRNRILLSLFLLASFFLFLHPIDSGDFFHHIITGRFIMEHGSLPYNDTFTFSAYGKPWTAHSWGSGLLYYLVYQLAGIPGVTVFFAALGVATVGFLLLLAKKYTQLSTFIYAFVCLAGLLLSLYWPSRPLVWASLLSCVLLFLLSMYKKYHYVLPVFFFVWGLLYGSSSLLGIAMLGLFLLSKKDHWTKKNLLIFVLSFGTSCLNGYGLRSVFFGLFDSSSLQSQDWFPIYTVVGQQMLPAVTYRILGYSVWVALVIVLLLQVYRNHKQFFKNHVFESLLVVGILAPFLSFRYLPLVPIVSLPFIFLSAQLLTKKMTRVMAWTIAAVCLVFFLIRFSHYPTGVGIQDERSLTDVVRFMKQYRIVGNVFVSQDLGSYVSWTMPESKVFYDTRDDLFTKTNVFRDLTAVTTGSVPITTLLDRYQATIVIGRPNPLFHPLTKSPRWKIIYFKDNYFVAVRR